MAAVDYAIVLVLLISMIAMVLISNRYTKSVSDFLVSGRSAGRYILTISKGMIWVGAINIIGMFEMYMEGGFTVMWWDTLWTISGVYAAITGFGAYRFRQTRSLTLAQFFEVRYNKTVRIISGIFSWLTGILSFGLFPAVGARFFMYFLGMPEAFEILGFTVQTFPVLLVSLVTLSLFFVCFGGHIAILITDFLQGSFTHIASVVIMLILAVTVFDWSKIAEVLQMAPAGMSQVNPNDTGKLGDFNIWFFAVAIFARWYNVMSYSAEQTYISSAKSAHEFKLSATLHFWRWLALCVFFMVLVLVVKMYLYHPSYAETASHINSILDTVSSDPQNPIRKQLTVTVALREVLPVGLKGLFCGIMLAALISTYDSFMHTFGSVFLQDVVMPFRKKAFSNKEHILWLRVSAVGVAAFAVLFSALYTQRQSILMFFAMINNLWLAPSGAVILGGLYWKRGTSRGAIWTLIVGAVLAAIGIFGVQGWPWLHEKWPSLFASGKFPINSQIYFFLTILIVSCVYVIVSLCDRKIYELDKLLRRGRYAAKEDQIVIHQEKIRWYEKLFGVSKEFGWFDKLTAYIIVGWCLGWAIFVVIGTVVTKIFPFEDSQWIAFWKFYLIIGAVLAVGVTLWFVIGGFRDLFRMFKQLGTEKRDFKDDGFVEKKTES